MTQYTSAEEAELAFYAAFEKADIDGMMRTWAPHDDVICIHPGAPRVEGLLKVRESWMELFRDPPILKFSLTDVRISRSESIAVHQIREEIEIDGQYISIMLSTNVYVLGQDQGWKLTSRHSSPDPDDYELEDPFDDDELDETGDKVVFH